MAGGDRTVLVTGGAGFSGGYLVRALLDAGYRVVVLDVIDFRAETRFVIGERIGEVVLERGSVDNFALLLDLVQRHRPWGIAHLAANMDFGMLDRYPQTALRLNAEGAVNVYEAARLFGVRKVVAISSIGVIGRRIYEPIDANHPTVLASCGPIGGYGAAKLAAEAFAYVYHQSAGLDVRIVRPSALYGFGMSWFAPNYMKNIVEPAVLGEPVRLTTGGKMPRDYIHVADFADLMMKVFAAPDSADRIFYAATGLPLRTGGDVGAIVRALVPGAAVEVGGELTPDDEAELNFRGMISIENARSQLGWEPRFARIEDGIADYIARLRAFLAAGGTPTPRPPLQRAPGGG